MLLVLDIDETLIHAAETPLERPADFVMARFAVYLRPQLAPFLDFCFQNFAVGVWTSASASYAQVILRHILPQRDQLVFVYSSWQCTHRLNPETREYYPRKPIKRLKTFGYPKERILAIDDSPEKWELSYGNLIRVAPFEGDLNDDELPRLMAYLTTLKDVPNVRVIEKRRWRFEDTHAS
jgi:carboxy-terminal domain RNA polymerase II polypeptide A small phosphatase